MMLKTLAHRLPISSIRGGEVSGQEVGIANASNQFPHHYQLWIAWATGAAEYCT